MESTGQDGYISATRYVSEKLNIYIALAALTATMGVFN